MIIKKNIYLAHDHSLCEEIDLSRFLLKQLDIKQGDFMLPRIWFAIDHRRCQNVVRTSVTLHFCIVCHFLVSPRFDII